MNDPRSKFNRRRVFAGAGTLGALAAAAAVLPVVKTVEPASAKPQPDGGDKAEGYRLTAHVQRYYQTTKV